MLRGVIMGVAGCGKSSVGAALAATGHVAYVDGDDLHPPANVAKMAAGTPLTDADRFPWLRLVGEALRKADRSTLIGCSALKRAYRDLLREAAGHDLVFIHLEGSRDVITDRMAARTGHFMPVSLIDSQFAALEPLQADETGVAIDIDQPLEAVVVGAINALEGRHAWD